MSPYMPAGASAFSLIRLTELSRRRLALHTSLVKGRGPVFCECPSRIWHRFPRHAVHEDVQRPTRSETKTVVGPREGHLTVGASTPRASFLPGQSLATPQRRKRFLEVAFVLGGRVHGAVRIERLSTASRGGRTVGWRPRAGGSSGGASSAIEIVAIIGLGGFGAFSRGGAAFSRFWRRATGLRVSRARLFASRARQLAAKPRSRASGSSTLACRPGAAKQPGPYEPICGSHGLSWRKRLAAVQALLTCYHFCTLDRLKSHYKTLQHSTLLSCARHRSDRTVVDTTHTSQRKTHAPKAAPQATARGTGRPLGPLHRLTSIAGLLTLFIWLAGHELGAEIVHDL